MHIPLWLMGIPLRLHQWLMLILRDMDIRRSRIEGITGLTAAASQVAERLMTPILEDLPFSSGDRVLAFVNGMGGTPLLELYIVYAEVAKIAADHGLTIERNLIGNYITSLEMQGCSITLVKLDDEMVRYWDAPVNTPALRWGA